MINREQEQGLEERVPIKVCVAKVPKNCRNDKLEETQGGNGKRNKQHTFKLHSFKHHCKRDTDEANEEYQNAISWIDSK